jgi:hypothetical protein
MPLSQSCQTLVELLYVQLRSVVEAVRARCALRRSEVLSYIRVVKFLSRRRAGLVARKSNRYWEQGEAVTFAVDGHNGATVPQGGSNKFKVLVQFRRKTSLFVSLDRWSESPLIASASTKMGGKASLKKTQSSLLSSSKARALQHLGISPKTCPTRLQSRHD